MNRTLFLWCTVVVLAAGCAAPPETPPSPGIPTRVGELYPGDALVTQRGVLTVHGRQFPLTGYVARSETNGLRLVMTESFGGVIADVLVKADGKVFVMQSKSPMREAWVEKYIAADLRCLFGRAAPEDCPGQVLGPTAFMIKRRQYRLDLRTVDVKPGAPPAELFDEKAGKKK